MRTVIALVLFLLIAFSADAITGFSSAFFVTVPATGTCPANQFVNSISSSSVLCGSPPPDQQLFDAGNFTVDIANPGVGGTFSSLINFHRTFPTPPNVSLTMVQDNFTNSGAAITGIFDTYTVVAGGTATSTWDSMPAATTELFGTTLNRMYMARDSSANVITIAVNVKTAGAAGSKLFVQFSGDLVTWSDPCSGTGAATIASTGLKIGICSVSSNLGAFNYMRIAGSNGNGVASPIFGLLTVELEISASIIIYPYFGMCLIQVTGPCSPVVSQTQFQFVLILSGSNQALGGDARFIIGWTATSCSGASPC